MDLRTQKTKNSIFSAFIELRASKPVEKITIRELTQRANISKQTFYLHFKDIYDLSDYLENDAISSLIKDLIFAAYPDYKDNLQKNITISLLIQGSVHTFLKYKEENTEQVIDLLAETVGRIADKP